MPSAQPIGWAKTMCRNVQGKRTEAAICRGSTTEAQCSAHKSTLSHNAKSPSLGTGLLLAEPYGAGKEARTLDLYLGKVSLYQLS